MFAAQDCRTAGRFSVDVAFTDRWGGVSGGQYESLDLTRQRPGAEAELATNWGRLASAFEVRGFATMRQVHGAEVCEVATVDGPGPTCDGLVTSVPGVALCVRVGDCVPLVLADVTAGVVGVAHVGRLGVVARVVTATLAGLADKGASALEAWVGPHICGGCYEVPSDLRDQVAEAVPAAFSCTTWGTPSVDIGAAVVAELRAGGCARVVESELCTRESGDLFSYRRQGPSSGRLGGLVVLRETGDGDTR